MIQLHAVNLATICPSPDGVAGCTEHGKRITDRPARSCAAGAVYRSATKSSRERPAWRSIDRSVPWASSRCIGTIALRSALRSFKVSAPRPRRAAGAYGHRTAHDHTAPPALSPPRSFPPRSPWSRSIGPRPDRARSARSAGRPKVLRRRGLDSEQITDRLQMARVGRVLRHPDRAAHDHERRVLRPRR